MENNPWNKLESKEVYDNPWIHVEEHKVLNPAGNKGIYGVVHFKNVALGIIPIDEEGYSYLVGQYRYPLEAYSWEIPEGGGKLDIDPLLSAQRELKEETGVDIPKESMHFVGVFDEPDRDPRGRVISMAYATRVRINSISPKAADDARDVKWLPWDEFMHLPNNTLAFDHKKIINAASKAFELTLK